MLGTIVIPKKRHDRLLKEKDIRIARLETELESYKQMHRKFKDNKNKEIESLRNELDILTINNKENIEKSNKVTYKLNCQNKQISELLIDNCTLQNTVAEKEREIFIIRTFLNIEVDKTIKRYENIKKRTKKAKIKNKCERKIENYMMRKLAYKPKQELN